MADVILKKYLADFITMSVLETTKSFRGLKTPLIKCLNLLIYIFFNSSPDRPVNTY